MFLRLLFVLLIALNIAVGAWLLLGQNDARGHFITDPGVPELHLLSERPMPPVAVASVNAPPTAASITSSAAPSPAVASGNTLSYACMAIGPFATQEDLRIARSAIATQVERMRARQEQTTQSRGWWIHLPPSSSHAAALAVARQLGARNIQDYFVVGSGDDLNTVSLGLFKDPANARKRLDEIIAAGFPRANVRAHRNGARILAGSGARGQRAF